MINLIPFDGYEFVPGGVCASKGFVAGGLHWRIQEKSDQKCLAMIYSKTPAGRRHVHSK